MVYVVFVCCWTGNRDYECMADSYAHALVMFKSVFFLFCVFYIYLFVYLETGIDMNDILTYSDCKNGILGYQMFHTSIGSTDNMEEIEQIGGCHIVRPKKSDIAEFDPFYIRGLLREGFVRIVEGRGRLGGYFFKCLQTSVLGGFAGIQRDRVARFLIEGCCNNDASGCVGTPRQAQNVEQVQIILEAECVFFWVYESFSLAALLAGELVGRWFMGSSDGVCAGVLVWLSWEKHVVRLDDSCGFLSKMLTLICCDEVAPWCRYSVGAPKKKGRRGWNFAQGGPQCRSVRPSVEFGGMSVGYHVLSFSGGSSVCKQDGMASMCSGLDGGLAEVCEEGVLESGLSSQSGLTILPVSGLGSQDTLIGDDVGTSASLCSNVFSRESKPVRLRRLTKRLDEEDARRFQPIHVDESLCMALLWNRGCGKLQCSFRPLRGSDVCGKHVGAPHGKVRGPIPSHRLDH